MTISSEDSILLAGKVAIVTGSGRENGMGSGIALALARAGARVVINHVSEASTTRAATVASSIESEVGEGKVAVVRADISTAEGVQELVKKTLQSFNVDHIDIIINNAVYYEPGRLFGNPPEEITKVFQVSVVGPLLLLEAAYPHMSQNGRIINIGTVASKIGFYQKPIYAAAKAAMDQLTFSLAREIGREGKHITINTLAPGLVATHKSEPVPGYQTIKNHLLDMTRVEDRVGTMDDVTGAVLFLASEKSRWITGQYISVSGGITGG